MNNNSTSESLVNHFCTSMSNYPELFLFFSEGQVYHTGSQIFYDSDSGAFGQFSYNEDYDPELEDNKESIIKEVSYINVSMDELESLHKAYLNWFGWYCNKKNEKILDTAKEMLVDRNYENIQP